MDKQMTVAYMSDQQSRDDAMAELLDSVAEDETFQSTAVIRDAQSRVLGWEATREARAILAETEPPTPSYQGSLARGINWPANTPRPPVWPERDALIESLAAILPELDRLESNARREAGGLYLGAL